jgi:hypothetical protein
MDRHYAVTIAGLPKMFVKASSPVEVKTKLRKMLKRPTEDIIDVERVTDADVRKHFRDMLKPDVQNEETYSPQKHEWGTDASTKHAKELTPGEGKKKMKRFKQFSEAEYQGRKVTLNKPMAGDVKKSKVYVKDPQTGNVKKVNFGDKNMKIKKSIPARRKSFRARHNCDNPGPKTKARYWSCKAW